MEALSASREAADTGWRSVSSQPSVAAGSSPMTLEDRGRDHARAEEAAYSGVHTATSEEAEDPNAQ
jgi:hypothetical protein